MRQLRIVKLAGHVAHAGAVVTMMMSMMIVMMMVKTRVACVYAVHVYIFAIRCAVNVVRVQVAFADALI